MTLTHSRPLGVKPVSGGVDAITKASPLEGTAEALSATYHGPNVDWTYSETAEGRTGETPINGLDMDGEPGLIYAGPAGASAQVAFTNVDVKAAGTGASLPEATDQYTVGIFRNNELVKQCDEGWQAEFDSETVEFNGDGVVTNLQSGDVLRIGLLTHESSEDSLQLTVDEGGEINIV